VLIGRSAERALIDSLLASAREGRGGALVVRGEPGIGKSALLAYAEEQASSMRVLRARGVEAEAEIAFSGLYELVRPVLALADDLPERQAAALRGALGLGPPVDSRLLIGGGALSLLAAASDERPLLCLIDDAHWLDAASSDALLFVARRLEADGIVMLFAARDGDPQGFEPRGLPVLSLPALAQEEAAELLRGSGLSESVVTDLHRAAAGNPLALLELPAVLSEAQRAGREPLPDPLPVSTTIQDAYARRIESLPEPTRRALVVAAAEPSGDLVVIERACAGAGVDPAALVEAEDAGLIAIADARVVFRHPLVSGAAYGLARPSDRRRAHAALADAVGAEDGSRQAWHLAEAAAAPDGRVAEALEDAARATYARSGYRSAAVMLQRAAALTPPSAKRAERLYFAAILRFYAHDIAHALTLLDEAEAASPDGDVRARARLLRLALWYYRDPVRAATLLLEEAERSGDDRPDEAAVASAFAACFRAHLRDSEGALEAARATRRHASRSDERYAAFATVGAGVGFVAAGLPEEAESLREQAVALFQAREWRYENPEDWVRGYMGVYAGSTLILLGEHDTVCERVASLAAEFVPGDEVSLMLARGLVGTAEYLRGRWVEARSAIADSLRIAGEIGWLGPQVHGYSRILGQLAAAQGSEEEARAQHDAASRSASIEWAGYLATGALAQLALGRGDYVEAAERYEADVLPLVGPLALYHDVADAVEAYVRAGRGEEAERWRDAFAAQAARSGWPWALARSAHLHALTAAADEKELSFETALEWHERARQPFLRARTQLAYGEHLRRGGERRRARELLRAALTTFESLGAVPWAEQAATQLRATGEQVRPRRGPDASRLTPQELQVSLVVAAGATNKEAAAQLFLSPKTIEKHLGSAYRKLGLRSRADLARLLGAEEPELAAHAGGR